MLLRHLAALSAVAAFGVVTGCAAVTPEPAPPPTAPAVPIDPARFTEGEFATFAAWQAAFRRRAEAEGISPATLDRSLNGLQPDPVVLERDAFQPEFTRAIWDYLDRAVSNTRISNGRAAAAPRAALLAEIEERHSVDRNVVVAIWGLESAYGANYGNRPVIRSLATLAWDGRRRRFAEEQLIAALKIVEAGDISPGAMVGSWAGAMGHTQFIPTSFLAYAVDHEGDGRRDIWDPSAADALASTANYLARFGWEKGVPAAVEVRLPEGFDYATAKRDYTLTPLEWAVRGVVGRDGKPVGDHGQAAILLPAGGQGVALMIFDNFSVIEAYNGADAYVIGIGHLSDRLTGRAPFQAPWPRGDRVLSFTEKKELQTRLTKAGFDTQGIDGRTGPNTIKAVRAYQLAQGLVPDGYPTLNLLERLR